jgi:hypothetical protein
MTIETTAVACALRAIMAHRVSTVVVNTVGNLSAVNIPAGSFGVVSTGNLNAKDTLAGSLNAMDTRAGSSAAANIPAASTVGASMVNVEGMASIATECTALYVGKKLSGSHAGEPFRRLRTFSVCSQHPIDARPTNRSVPCFSRSR